MQNPFSRFLSNNKKLIITILMADVFLTHRKKGLGWLFSGLWWLLEEALQDSWIIGWASCFHLFVFHYPTSKGRLMKIQKAFIHVHSSIKSQRVTGLCAVSLPAASAYTGVRLKFSAAVIRTTARMLLLCVWTKNTREWTGFIVS